MLNFAKKGPPGKPLLAPEHMKKDSKKRLEKTSKNIAEKVTTRSRQGSKKGSRFLHDLT